MKNPIWGYIFSCEFAFYINVQLTEDIFASSIKSKNYEDYF
jgi:hypothetical protein